MVAGELCCKSLRPRFPPPYASQQAVRETSCTPLVDQTIASPQVACDGGDDDSVKETLKEKAQKLMKKHGGGGGGDESDDSSESGEVAGQAGPGSSSAAPSKSKKKKSKKKGGRNASEGGSGGDGGKGKRKAAGEFQYFSGPLLMVVGQPLSRLGGGPTRLSVRLVSRAMFSFNCCGLNSEGVGGAGLQGAGVAASYYQDV